MDTNGPLPDSDEALVARAKCDGEAFGCLYDRYVEEVYRFTYRRPCAPWGRRSGKTPSRC